MSASDHLNDTQFRFHQANPREVGGAPYHVMEAWQPEHADTPWAQAHPRERDQYTGSSVDPGFKRLGALEWHHKSGEILGLYVEPEHRRQGLATEMFRRAQEAGVRAPRHSTFRTDSGDAWAQRVGGHLPRRRRDSPHE